MKADYQTVPSPATRAAIVALLKADAGVSLAHRARILAAFDAPDGAPPDGFRPASEVARTVGMNLATLLRWAERGVVAGRRVGSRLVLVREAEVKKMLAVSPPRRGRRPGSVPKKEKGA